MTNYYSTDYKKILEEETVNLAGIKKTQQDAINKTHDSQVTVLNNQYGKAVDDTKVAYESEYERNAVQKLINEKQIAEKNANLGLTDSGLNRTQQTAVQLSYANQKGDIDLAKQDALDTLSQNLASSLSSIEQSRITSLADLDTSIDAQAQSNAISRYNANVEANAKMYESEQEAEAKIETARIEAAAKQLSEKTNVLNSKNSTLGNLQGSFASNGITSIHNADGSTTYTDTVTGTSVTMDAGINPFTGQNNLTENTATAKAAQKYGTFSNGYQPKGIIGYGELSGALKNSDGTYLSYEINGRNNTIWKAEDKKGNEHYFVWDGNQNEYVEMTKEQFEKAKAEANKY